MEGRKIINFISIFFFFLIIFFSIMFFLLFFFRALLFILFHFLNIFIYLFICFVLFSIDPLKCDDDGPRSISASAGSNNSGLLIEFPSAERVTGDEWIGMKIGIKIIWGKRALIVRM